MTKWRQRLHREFEVLRATFPTKGPEPLRERRIESRSHVQRTQRLKERFQGLADAARFVDWWVTGCNRSGIPVGCRFSDLIALQNGDPCAALRQEVGATDSNYATAHNDGVAIG